MEEKNYGGDIHWEHIGAAPTQRGGPWGGWRGFLKEVALELSFRELVR